MKSKYTIVCGSRSGSTLLCDLLKSTKRAGDPQEFFNEELIQDFGRFNKGDGYVDGIINATKTENEVFGVKVVGCFDQLEGLLESKLKLTHYVYLERENKVAQAISRYKSWQTNKWHSNTPLDVDYSYGDIKWCYDDILAEDIFLQKFIIGKNALRISYEKDLLNNREQTVRCILNHLGVSSKDLPELKTERVKISNYASKEMEKRFKEELKTKQISSV
jgi:LPS sulfotransferase NodH